MLANAIIKLLKKRSVVILLLVFSIVLGVNSVFNIKKESAPEVDVPVFSIFTSYPGAKSKSVANQISKELEKKIYENAKDIKRLTSFARDNYSLILVEFNDDKDKNEAKDELKDAIDKAKNSLPDDAEEPELAEIDFASLPVLSFALSSNNNNLQELYSKAKKLKENIELLDNVRSVQADSLPKKKMFVLLNDTDYQTNFDAGYIARQIKLNNSSFPVGGISNSFYEQNLTIDGKLKNRQDLENFKILSQNGEKISLSSIATIKEAYEKPDAISNLCDSECVNKDIPSTFALSMHALKDDNAKITTLSEKLTEKITEFANENNLKFFKIFDRGFELKKDLESLLKSGIQTMILIFLVLFIFVGFKEALIASISIPISFILAISALDYTGYTLNFVSLFALILSMGILVDSAIVIIEGIDKFKDDLDSEQASYKSIKTFARPTLAGTLTTIFVFLPMFGVSGVVGKFIASIPSAVSFVLLASLFVSFVFVPFLYILFDKYKFKFDQSLNKFRTKLVEKMENEYEKYLRKFLAIKNVGTKSFAYIVLALFVSFLLPVFGIVKIVFFGEENNDYIFADLKYPYNFSIENTNLHLKNLEKLIKSEPAMEYFISSAGISSNFADPWGLVYKQSNRANMFIKLKSDREISASEFMSKMRDNLQKAPNLLEFKVVSQKKGAPSLAPVMVSVYHDSLEKVDEIAKEVFLVMSTSNKLADVSAKGVSESNSISIKNTRAPADFNSNTLTIANSLRANLKGQSAGKLDDINETEIIVKKDYSGTQNPDMSNFTSLQDFMNQKISNNLGQNFTLSSLFKTELEKDFPNILRSENKYMAQISAELVPGHTAKEANKELRTKLKKIMEKYPNAKFKFEGESVDIDKSFSDMFAALIIGSILMFVLLLFEFSKFRYAFVILFNIPVAIIGIIFGFAITQSQFSFPAIMGLSALAGIIVNNAIILVDSYINMLKDSANKKEAIIKSAKSRLRPILLTSVTTTIGAIPLLFSAEIWKPFATALIFGLIFASVISLFTSPALLLSLDKDKR